MDLFINHSRSPSADGECPIHSSRDVNRCKSRSASIDQRFDKTAHASRELSDAPYTTARNVCARRDELSAATAIPPQLKAHLNDSWLNLRWNPKSLIGRDLTAGSTGWTMAKLKHIFAHRSIAASALCMTPITVRLIVRAQSIAGRTEQLHAGFSVAQSPSHESNRLKLEVGKFKGTVRAA